MILDVGLTPEALILGILLLLGAVAVAALCQAAIAVLVLGPRFWEAMALPAVAALVTMVGFVFIGSGSVSPLPSALVAGFLVAFLVAWLQRDSLQARDRAGRRAGRGILIAGAVLSWLLFGLGVGLVVGAATRSGFPVLLCPLIGVLIALRPSVIRSVTEPPVAADGQPTTGMLDE